MAHPGICATDDAAFLETLKTTAKHMRYFLESKMLGSSYSIRFVRSDSVEVGEHIMLSHYRGAGPKLTIWCLCSTNTCPDGEFMRKIICDDGEYAFMLDISALGRHFKNAFKSGAAVDRVEVYERRREEDQATLTGSG